LERIELEAGVLIPGGDPREPDQHGVLPKLVEMCHERESNFKGRLREADQRPNYAFPLPAAFPSQTAVYGPLGQFKDVIGKLHQADVLLLQAM
jgi:hypothetical protein